MTSRTHKTELALAKQSGALLTNYLRLARKQSIELKFIDKNGKLQKIIFPRSAIDLLADILKKWPKEIALRCILLEVN